MASQTPNVRVGVAALIVHPDGRVLVGKRKGSHGSGTIQLPGGHLEFGEAINDCCVREALEETGLVVKPGAEVAAVTNDIFDESNKHYITLFVWCEMADPAAVPEVMEPEKCDGWFWASWDELKARRGSSEIGYMLFSPLHRLLDQKPVLEALRPSS